jgi:hypothetical protein
MILSFLVIWSALAWSQTPQERQHHRVSELQDKLTAYARDYLKTRLPDIPFLVTLRIEPLRRSPNSGYQVQNERLPFFEIAEEEIRDEWDDPSASLYVLQARIQKATLVVTLPQGLKDAEVDEIKDSLTTLLRLVPGRDEVRVERRSWSLGETFWNYVTLAASLLGALILGLLFVSRMWVRRLATAILQIKPKDSEKSDTAAMPVSAPAASLAGADSKSSANGALKFSDPLRTREFISGRIHELCQNHHFPNLDAMIAMDKVARLSPGQFGAVMAEFPKAKQEEIFSLSYQHHWLEAFSNPGELGPESLELIDRLSRTHYEGDDHEWQTLLIQVWRMGNDRPAFMKEIKRDEAFAILKRLPSSISIPVARIAFPGAWAVLLDAAYTPADIGSVQLKRLHEMAVKRCPRLEFEALARYRKDRDLLDFLHLASAAEEREIYEALPKGSYLWMVRPPFYKVFETDADGLKTLMEMVTLDEWSLALFNVPREMRKVIEDCFSSKQKYLFVNKMRAIDAAATDKGLMGNARARIAKVYFDYEQSRTQAKVDGIVKTESATKEDNGSESKAA